MKQFDPQKIYLNPAERKALHEVSKAVMIPDNVMDDYPYDRLLRLNLLEHVYCDDFPYVPVEGVISIPTNALSLSDNGKIYIAYLNEKRELSRTDSKRYWITTAIAVTALIKSFLPEISAGLERLLKLLGQ